MMRPVVELTAGTGMEMPFVMSLKGSRQQMDLRHWVPVVVLMVWLMEEERKFGWAGHCLIAQMDCNLAWVIPVLVAERNWGL